MAVFSTENGKYFEFLLFHQKSAPVHESLQNFVLFDQWWSQDSNFNKHDDVFFIESICFDVSSRPFRNCSRYRGLVNKHWILLN